MAQFNDVKVYKELNLCDHSSNMFTHGNGRKNVLSYSGTTMTYGNNSDAMVLNGSTVSIDASDSLSLGCNKLLLDSYLYGTSDPPSDGTEGQIYFKIV